NSPNTVYECLEHRIPFIASDAGGIPELVAPDDRARVLFPPTAEGVEEALRRELSNDLLLPARPAFDAKRSFAAWAKVIETELPSSRSEPSSGPPVDVVVVARPTSRGTSARLRAALDRQSYADFTVIECDGPSVERARTSGLQEGDAPYVVFL